MNDQELGGSEAGRGKLSEEVRAFVDRETWTFARTMPTWPHEYLVRDRVDERLFEQLVLHIRESGREGKFYERALIYYEEDGLLYWTMGSPLKDTTIINRCKVEDSFEYRQSVGRLPSQL